MKYVAWVLLAVLPVTADAAKKIKKPFKPLNPFGRRSQAGMRRDVQPGYLLLSTGEELPGRIYLTRDKRLMVTLEADDTHVRIPWGAVRRIDCLVAEEHVEREWRWKENASNVKIYTGRTYPWRLYTHKIKVKDGRVVAGKMDAVIYMKVEGESKRRRFLTHKRDKGTWGDRPKDLVYVKRVVLGEAALKNALKRRKARLEREQAQREAAAKAKADGADGDEAEAADEKPAKPNDASGDADDE